MTDDDRLGQLFRTAASDEGAPPPTFDHADVVSASRRITARRRSALIGAACAVFAVVGVGAVALPGPAPTASTAAAPAQAPNRAADQAGDRAGDQAAAGQAAAPEAAPGGSGPAAAAAPMAAPPAAAGPPLGPGQGPCADRQDPQLRALLEQVLPEVTGAPAAASTDECRPGGERYVTVELPGGLFGVAYLPPGTAADRAAPGTVSAPTASGGTVLVHTGPVGGTAPPPLQDRLDEVAGYLAPRL